MNHFKPIKNNPLRDHEQSMGIWINEPMFRDPERMNRAVLDCTLPLSRPQRLEACRQLSSALPNKLVSCEGEIHGVQAGNIVFLTDLDPQIRLIEQIEEALPKAIKAHRSNLLWRLYRDASGDSLIVVSATGEPLKESFAGGSPSSKSPGARRVC